MRKLARPVLVAALLLSVIGVRAVLADEYNKNGTVAQGQNIQTLVVGQGAKVCLQCPNIDAGVGQKVFYRPGGCTGCVIDAGPGDILVDFTQATDCYPIQLRYSQTNTSGNPDRIHLRGLNASDVIYCAAPPRSP